MLPILQKPAGNRMVIYAKDVMLITGKSERTARYILQSIRKKCNKPPGSFITISEFCDYTGMKIEEVRNAINS